MFKQQRLDQEFLDTCNLVQPSEEGIDRAFLSHSRNANFHHVLILRRGCFEHDTGCLLLDLERSQF